MMLALLLATAATPAPGPTLGPIRLQLYYKTTGTLSADLAGRDPSLWNTGAGEGDAREPAEDLLVSVPIRMPPGRYMGDNSEVPLTISVRDRRGRVLATRTISFISIPYRDPVWSPLWVPDVQCAGPIVATARWGKQVRTARLSFDCGE